MVVDPNPGDSDSGRAAPGRLLRGVGRRAALLAAMFAAAPALAVVDGEPGSCDPVCRAGFMCKAGRCVSLCNPPCDAGFRCARGDCERIPPPGEPVRTSSFGIQGVFLGALGGGATHLGEVRLEVGGKYLAFQLGPAFGEGVTMLRAAIGGHVPFQLFDDLPLFLLPTLGLGYAHSWLANDADGHHHDLFLAPGVRLRYDLTPRLALIADLIQVQINFLRLYSDEQSDVDRIDVVPVTWNLALGLAFLY